jgi:hypothetical protein
MDCKFRGYGNREVAYCHYQKPWPDISQECDENKCPLKKESFDGGKDESLFLPVFRRPRNLWVILSLEIF